MMMTTVNQESNYRELVNNYTRKQGKEERTLFILSLSRLLAFIAGVAVTIAGFYLSAAFGLAALLLSVTLFLFLVRLYSNHSGKQEFYSNLVAINKSEIKALANDYSDFNEGDAWIDPDHDFSNDVDLFGKDSLFQFINRTITGYGRSILAGWLSDPYRNTVNLAERQEAVKELAGKLGWRQEFAAYGLRKNLEKGDIQGLLDWLGQKSEINSSFLYRVVIYLLPALTVSSLALLIAGIIPYSIFSAFFLVNLILILSRLKQTNRIHGLVTKKYTFLESFVSLLSSFRNETFRSGILAAIKAGLAEDPGSAIDRIRRLSRIMKSFDSRLNMFAGFMLNGLILWDLHCINSLERWKKSSEKLLPALLSDIGQIDAYNSLGNFAYNNPGFAWPEISLNGEILSAICMGHPLLPGKRRICNNFTISGKGRIIIITGANMAGKSTFLRTVAVNYILAMAGAPVCAESFIFRPVRIFTSMRTTDSLSHNESYFYAELRRLKILREKMEADGTILFILDEILKGTNSADKSSGSKLFMKKCIEIGGTGMIATHDTSLAEAGKEYPGTIINKCFEIDIEGDSVSFDYKLRDGITTRMNASLLMKEMGITD